MLYWSYFIQLNFIYIDIRRWHNAFNQGTSSFAYDQNGNMTSDGTRGATVIYNPLNLPAQVALTGRTVKYVYDGSGSKLQMTSPAAGTLYAGAFEYTLNGTLLRVGLEEGQLIRTSEGLYEINYYLRDHLGNVRQVLKEDGTVLQETEYYAFGLPVTKTGNDADNKYLYNGKEKQPETGWLDYGARMYMAELGRWGTVDPHIEKYESVSPYSYTFNNPIRFLDIKGRDPGDVIVLFAGANLNPFAKDPYGITSLIKTRIEQNLNGGSVEKFLSNYAFLKVSPNPHNPTYYSQNFDELTQEAYEYIKANLNEEKGGKIVIYGYSWGGVLATYLTERLAKDNLSVENLILIDAANGRLSNSVNRIISNANHFTNVYQKTPSAIRSRGFPAKKRSSKQDGVNVRVDLVKNEEGKWVQASHGNVDDGTAEDVINSLLKFLNR